MGHRIWALGFLGLMLVHAAWRYLHDAPPAWDMAHHQIMGWRLLEAAREGRLLEALVNVSDYYPPFYYALEAVVLSLVGETRWLAFLVNLPGLALLSWSTARLAWALTGSAWAPLAGWLVLSSPLTSWTSRETLLDPWLSAWTAFALLLIHRSRALQSRSRVLWLAPVIAAGMLTKWSFVLFVAPPLIWLMARSRDRRTALLNLVDLGLLSAPLVLWWYLPNAVSLFRRLQYTASGADWEMDPQLDSILGWIYYPRAISSYYLFLPLSLILVTGLLSYWWRSRRTGRTVSATPAIANPATGASALRRLLVVTLLGGSVLLTLLKAKDPRYVMPLLAPLSILLVDLWKDRRVLLVLIAGLAALQFVATSFILPGIPARIGFFGIPGDRDYRSMRQEWVWFQRDYFGVTGPPRREDWRLADLLEAVPAGARIGFVPDSASFHPGLLVLEGLRRGKPVHVIRLGLQDNWPASLGEVDWVVGKTGDQGISFITWFNEDVYAAMEQLRWPQVKTWELPDGSQILLWRNPSLSR